MLRIRNDHSRSNVIERTELSPNFDKRSASNIDIQKRHPIRIWYERSRGEMSRGEMSRGTKCLRYEASRDEMSRGEMVRTDLVDVIRGELMLVGKGMGEGGSGMGEVTHTHTLVL